MTDTATVELLMPEMGESVTEGTVLEWHVSEGDAVEEGQTVVEVSTDKVDAEVPATAAGIVTKILVGPDEVVAVGQALCEIDPSSSSGSGDEATIASNGADETTSQPKPEQPSEAAPAAPSEAPTVTNGEVRATPVARRIAAERGIDLTTISGSGVGGKVTKSDIAGSDGGANGASGKPAVAEAAPDGELKPLRGSSAALARAMDESRTIPTATSFRTLAVNTLEARRKALNRELAERGSKVSFTHLIAWAIVKAAADWPVMARHFVEVDGKPHVVEAAGINLGIAVDVERKGSRGLMVPCIKDAGSLDFAGFHARYEELITKTREGELSADDFQGTNVTLTNPGGLGTVASVPRLLSGQGTIIATGSIAYPPEWSNHAPDRLASMGISKVMTVTSTYDHRVIQGAESGSFLRRIDELLSGADGFYESVAADLGLGGQGVGATAEAEATAVAADAVASEGAVKGMADAELLQGVQAATSLLKAYRTHGHLAARLDPLGSEPLGDPAIEPENLNLTPELMARMPADILRIGVEGETLLDALPRMQEAYCGTMAYQFEHLASHQRRVWLRDMIERGAHRRPLSAEEKRSLLYRLIDVFGFERFLEKAFLGQKLFTIEGLDAVVPMLDAVFARAQSDGAREVVIGMAHRGRLAVLAHNLGRSLQSILAEFEGAKQLDSVKAVAAIPAGGTGDVKYHHGHDGTHETPSGETIDVRLFSNPSHLEFVDPVVEGAARAEQSEVDGPRIEHDPGSVIPVLLHGDAAFPAQGVVAETLNLQALDGYATGGTIHIIQNNQIGFTTEPREGRSTPYAADIAKGFNVPIVHVNADDPEACVSAVRLAMAYRQRWGRDFVIDAIGYRRYGHNETDEPAYTQPLMSARIREHPPVSELYAERLISEETVSAEQVETRKRERQEALKAAHDELRRKMEAGDFEEPSGTGTTELDRSRSPKVDTKVSESELRSLNEDLVKVPESFTVHRKLRKPLERHRAAVDDGGIEFAQAESLAFASLLSEGTHIRLTGQDTARGTFSQRHLVLHDERTGLRYCPMQHLPEATAPFELYNSPLSEAACLGFEYGYSVISPEALVLWEAQFGDFANAGQVAIDNFIASGESKWGQMSRLTLLLPHGYEGGGPEHSSARIERFIQLGAEGNIRIAYPSNAAQYFHLLRRQAKIAKARPLVVFTPKALLRMPEAAATLSDLSEGEFRFLIDDARAAERRESVERLVLCTGKIFYDIDAGTQRQEATSVALARVEMLYPFPWEEITEMIASYPNLREIVWAQEEPRNMGAWSVMQRRMPELLPKGVELGYVGRPSRASTSEGYAIAHRNEQDRIAITALVGKADPA